MLDAKYPLHTAPLGQKSQYTFQYDATLLFPVAREKLRLELGIKDELPFHGFDTWNAYEMSWLNNQGKPIVAIAEIIFPCDAPRIVESKSLKLYFNSFNNSKFASENIVRETIIKDLSAATGKNVTVNFYHLEDYAGITLKKFSGILLDNLDVTCDKYNVTPSLLAVESNEIVEETLYSNLLKSNCPVTGQPDWATIQIHYRGKKISHDSLVKYIVSYRNDNDFGEHCVERFYVDIMQQCKPISLTVHGRYSRRGGIDINPIRSSAEIDPADNVRFIR